MATKGEKKELLRTQIIDAARIYSAELAGKVFLYVYGHEFFEVSFKTDRFLHLTGVDSYLSAQRFYRTSMNGQLTTKQFFFSQSHPFAGAKKKLPCLKRLPELTKDYVCILKDHATFTITYKLSITNLEFTLGLTENIDSNGNKIDDIYLPRTLRVNDRSVEKSAGGEIVDFIFVRDASLNTYEKLIVSDSDKKLPNEIRNIVDSRFFESEVKQNDAKMHEGNNENESSEEELKRNDLTGKNPTEKEPTEDED